MRWEKWFDNICSKNFFNEARTKCSVANSALEERCVVGSACGASGLHRVGPCWLVRAFCVLHGFASKTGCCESTIASHLDAVRILLCNPKTRSWSYCVHPLLDHACCHAFNSPTSQGSRRWITCTTRQHVDPKQHEICYSNGDVRKHKDMHENKLNLVTHKDTLVHSCWHGDCSNIHTINYQSWHCV